MTYTLEELIKMLDLAISYANKENRDTIEFPKLAANEIENCLKDLKSLTDEGI